MQNVSVREFFMFVCFHGGKSPYLSWNDEYNLPVVVMSPAIKLQEGNNFAFSARWSLMQDHPWPIVSGRRHFMEMTDEEVIQAFYAWISTTPFPTRIVEDYMKLNGKSAARWLAREIKIKTRTAEPDAGEHDVDADENDWPEEQQQDEDEEEEEEEDERKRVEDDDTGIYRALRAGYLQEISSKDAITSRVVLENPKHDCYRKQRMAMTTYM